MRTEKTSKIEEFYFFRLYFYHTLGKLVRPYRFFTKDISKLRIPHFYVFSIFTRVIIDGFHVLNKKEKRHDHMYEICLSLIFSGKLLSATNTRCNSTFWK